MEVGILYCQDCFFSQRAHSQILKVLESMLGPDHQKLNLTVQTFDIKEIESHSKATRLHRSKVQVVILSHHFLDRLKHEVTVKKKTSPINSIFRPKRVIAILLSVSSQEIIEGFREKQFTEWKSIELKSSNKLDPEFYKTFSEQILRSYNLEQSINTGFSVFPKKITPDQPKIIVLFKTALEGSDKVHLDLVSGRQRNRINEVSINNPYAAMVHIPTSIYENSTCLIEVTVYVNGKTIGTKLIKFEHNYSALKEDPIEKMAVGLPGFRKILDDHISQQLSKNFRSYEDFSANSSLEILNEALTLREDDFPTAVHFAVNYGLEQTVCVLLYEGEGLKWAMTKNGVGDSAVDIAQEKGFASIGQTIKDLYEMTNTFGALQYIKELCDRHSEELELLAEQRNSSNAEGNQLDQCSTVEPIYQNEKIGSPSAHAENQVYMSLTENDTTDYERTVTIRIETPTDDREIEALYNQMDTSQISATSSAVEPNGQPSYVNVDQSKNENSISISRAQILQSYDVPPPPVIIQKPPRKIGASTNFIQQYDVPRESLNHYCHIPLTRPILPVKPTIKAPKPTVPVLSIKSSLAPIQSPDGYMCVENSPGNGISPPKPPYKPPRAVKPSATSISDSSTESEIKYPKVVPPVIGFGGFAKNGFLQQDRSPLPLTKQFSLDSTQEELLELMNDFKNNVYNLRELELLYENWKQRNDVQRDFKVRQKELKEIQKEYKKIQEKIRRETKKSGPVAKLLKLIPGSRKKISLTNSDPSAKYSSGTAPDPQTPPAAEDPERKVSDTSNSDRSTMSEASVQDSGVSDPDSEKDRFRDAFLAATYVEPSEIPVKATETTEPPKRPPKKQSVTTTEHPMTLNDRQIKESPIPSDVAMLTGIEVSNCTVIPAAGAGPNSGVPAPPPPPRVMKMDSPFSYINYEAKAKGLPKTQRKISKS